MYVERRVGAEASALGPVRGKWKSYGPLLSNSPRRIFRSDSKIEQTKISFSEGGIVDQKNYVEWPTYTSLQDSRRSNCAYNHHLSIRNQP